MPRRGKKKRKKKIPMSSNGRGASCAWCKRQLQSSTARSLTRATRDHVKPKSLGGNGRVWCCYQCNQIKGDMLPRQWRVFMRENPEWWKSHDVKPPHD